MKTALACAQKNVKTDVNPTAHANAPLCAQMAAMTLAKHAAQTTAKADAMQAVDVYVRKEATESLAQMAAIRLDWLAVISSAKMAAT